MHSYIKEISISNYRSFRQCCTIPLGNLTALVGYNNAGKSNILNALEWLITNGSLAENDFSCQDLPIEIVAEIVNVDEAVLQRLGTTHRRKIETFVFEEKVKIKRIQSVPGDKSTNNKFWLWDENAQDWRHNPAGIDAAMKKLFPDVIRINAMEDAASDASKAKSTSTIGKLLKLISGELIERHQNDVDETLGQVRNSLSAEGSDRFDGLKNIDTKINESIGMFFPRVSVKLDVPVPSLEELLGSGTIKIYEDDSIEGRAINYYGHGSQRSVQMALIKLLADMRSTAGDSFTAQLILIDEPELYLHPFAIEVLMDAFKALSEDGYQVAYSTHSAQMISRESCGSTILVRKNAENGTFIRKPLSYVINDVVDKPEHCKEIIYSLSCASQIFFSEKVIVTEGKTEKRVLPEIYRFMTGSSMGVNHIGLASLNGKDIYPKAQKIFSLLDMPAKFVADLDFAFALASRGEILEKEDPDYLALLVLLEELKSEGEIGLDDKGHPKNKKAPCAAEEAYRKLVAKEGAGQHINSIHEKLIENNIWVWPKGTIEDHIGNESKNELGLLKYVGRLKDSGVDEVCPDPHGVRRFINWIDA